jgi:hypothetical protein
LSIDHWDAQLPPAADIFIQNNALHAAKGTFWGPAHPLWLLPAPNLANLTAKQGLAKCLTIVPLQPI